MKFTPVSLGTPHFGFIFGPLKKLIIFLKSEAPPFGRNLSLGVPSFGLNFEPLFKNLRPLCLDEI
jgi:hypothetical protein